MEGREIMEKTKQTSTKLLVIAITAVAIIAAITTTSIGGARPAFAQACNTTPDGLACQGGGGYNFGSDHTIGGGGARYEFGTPTNPDFDTSGGGGHGPYTDIDDTQYAPGGGGGRVTCENINQPNEVCTSVGGGGGQPQK
jgi:hypothetical protein